MYLLLVAVIAAGVLGVASCGSSGLTTTENLQIGTALPVDNVEVSMEGLAFNPSSVTIPPGTNITWINNDSVTHTVVSDEGLFESGEMSGGDTFSHVFSAPGVYSYHCSLHPTIKGMITVQ